MQSRYLLDPSAASKSPTSPYDYKWEIPVTYVTSGAPKSKLQKWLTSNDPFLLINAQSGTDWIKFNVGQYGFYRVNYPEAEWENFAQLLMTSHEVMFIFQCTLSQNQNRPKPKKRSPNFGYMV